MSVLFYQQQAEIERSTLPWVHALQAEGLSDFKRLGFPTRKDEDWRYTSVDAFLQHSFQTKSEHATDASSNACVLVEQQSDVPVGHKIAIVNGVILGLDALRALLPPAVIVESLQVAMHAHPEMVQPYLNRILQTQHGFHAQNTAMLQLGLFIYVPAHICITEPILMVHWQTQADQAVYLRHLMIVETGASLTVIEDYQGVSGLRYYTNTISELYAGSKAFLHHYKIQRESALAFHVGHVAIQQAEMSEVSSHVLSFGGVWSRTDTCSHLRGPQALFRLNGIYALNEQQHMDHHTWVYHNAASCTSEQDYKGILTGRSRAVFNGQVHVMRDAQKTIAHQQNKNLLLSKQAEIDTKPQLDIAADDVSCTHGATVGQLDEDALFYFATRGIGEDEATKYLIQAFAADNLRALRHDALSTWSAKLLNHHLGSDYES